MFITTSLMGARVMIRPEQINRQTDGQTQTKGRLGCKAADRILGVWEGGV